MKYQEGPPYTTTIIQAKFNNPMQFNSDDNCIHRARSTFIDKSQFKKLPHAHWQKLITQQYIHLIICNNLDSKVCIRRYLISH